MSDVGSPSAPHVSHSEGEHRAEDALRCFTDWLFTNPRDSASTKAIVSWWEVRRLPFNLIIGTYGILCLVLFFATITTSGYLQTGEDAVEPLALMMAPIIVNVLYTLGWIVEAIYRRIEPDVSPGFGPRLFKLGLGLGVFFSTLPAAYWTGYTLMQWVGVAS
jgi:hypothetical protein